MDDAISVAFDGVLGREDPRASGTRWFRRHLGRGMERSIAHKGGTLRTPGGIPMADIALLSNQLKEMMKAGKVALGMNVRLARSGDIRSEERRVGKEGRSRCATE